MRRIVPHLLNLITLAAVAVLFAVGNSQRDSERDARLAQGAKTDARIAVLAAKADSVADTAAAWICAFDADLQRRYDLGREYQEKHPEGAPAIGLSAAEIDRQLDAQQSVIEHTPNVTCP